LLTETENEFQQWVHREGGQQKDPLKSGDFNDRRYDRKDNGKGGLALEKPHGNGCTPRSNGRKVTEEPRTGKVSS